MAWFRSEYVCIACDGHWVAEQVDVVEMHCPHCRTFDVAPYKSIDVTIVALKNVAATMRQAEARPAARQRAARLAAAH
jgi:hypothetical protein